MHASRKLTALGLILAFAGAWNPAVAEGPKRAQVSAAAEQVWWAFSAGIAPPAEEGRAARAVLEEHAKPLSEAERWAERLLTDPTPVMLAKAAWAAGERDAAASGAKAVLAKLAGLPRWDRGNVHHEMHILLGRLGLERGDLQESKSHLLESAKTSGSPQLDSFGPDWTLAEDLLAKGERATVAAYIEAAGAFWESGRERLAAWKQDLSEGKAPKFVAHRDGKVPPSPKEGPFPPSVGSPKGLLGVWESVSTSRGGIGRAMEFFADGTVRTRMVVLVHMRYRIADERLLLGEASEGMSMPLGKVEKDRWTTELEDGRKIAMERVGSPIPDQHPVVGVWSDVVVLSVKRYQKFDTDGWLSIRVPMAGLKTGTYEHSGGTLHVHIGDEASDPRRVSIEGDRLRLTESDGAVHEYRYAGDKPWYGLGDLP